MDLFRRISDELQAPYVLRWATLQRTNSFIPFFKLALTNIYSVVVTNTTNMLYFPQSMRATNWKGISDLIHPWNREMLLRSFCGHPIYREELLGFV